jgi:hypothetical protein
MTPAFGLVFQGFAAVWDGHGSDDVFGAFGVWFGWCGFLVVCVWLGSLLSPPTWNFPFCWRSLTPTGFCWFGRLVLCG